MSTHKGTAIITGASSGIGAAFARELARSGYNLILQGRRRELLQSLCDEVARNHGIKAEYLIAELSDPEDLRILENRVGGTTDLGMLVNCAGFSSLMNFSDEDIDGQENIIRVHIIASVRLTHAALPVMLQRRHGAIINVSSVAAYFISPGSVMYCATKLFLNSFTEALHLELRGTGIRVQALCPGYTTSDFHTKLGYDTSKEFFKNFMPAERVVETSLKYLDRGKVVCIPGFKYKIAAQLPRIIPRPLLYRLVMMVTKGRKYPAPR